MQIAELLKRLFGLKRTLAAVPVRSGFPADLHKRAPEPKFKYNIDC